MLTPQQQRDMMLFGSRSKSALHDSIVELADRLGSSESTDVPKTQAQLQNLRYELYALYHELPAESAADPIFAPLFDAINTFDVSLQCLQRFLRAPNPRSLMDAVWIAGEAEARRRAADENIEFGRVALSKQFVV
jgi:hypothetical protein